MTVSDFRPLRHGEAPRLDLEGADNASPAVDPLQWQDGYKLAAPSSSKKAAISRPSSSGSSTDGKWPPLGMGVHRRMLYRRSAHSRGGLPSSMNWCAKTATAVGTVTTSVRPSSAASHRLST